MLGQNWSAAAPTRSRPATRLAGPAHLDAPAHSCTWGGGKALLACSSSVALKRLPHEGPLGASPPPGTSGVLPCVALPPTCSLMGCVLAVFWGQLSKGPGDAPVLILGPADVSLHVQRDFAGGIKLETLKWGDPGSPGPQHHHGVLMSRGLSPMRPEGMEGQSPGASVRCDCGCSNHGAALRRALPCWWCQRCANPGRPRAKGWRACLDI